MMEKEQNVGENGGLLTEPYDNDVKMTEDQNAFALFEGQKQVPLAYNLTEEEVKTGLLRFQKKTVYKKNWVYTALLGLIFIGYLASIVWNPKDGLALFLCFLSPALILFIWMLPYNHRKKTAKAVAETNETFHMTVCETGVVAGEGETASYMFYENEPIEVYQYPEMLLFNISKERIFVIPRRCVDDTAWDEAATLLEQGLGEKFTKFEQ